MSKPASAAGGIPTPVPSSPPASESFFSEFDGTIAGSVLDTSYGDIWEPPADASALNIVSWKLDVDAQVEDGVDKRGFNAISTVLNHPTKKANPLRASRKPLPPLAQPPPILPKPQPPSYYESYLKSIGPLYEKFVQGQQAVASSSAVPATELDAQTRKAVDLPSLDSIPSMFFDSNFDIANPSTWAEVMAAADSSPKPRDTAVQDSLSTHLDHLESHLVHEITLRSSSFFSALANLQDLNSESTSCLKRISDLKSALSDVGGKQARKGLEIIEAQSRLRSLRVTEGGIKRMAELDDLLRIAKGMADGGDWAGALGCVEDIVLWWQANSPEESPGSDSVHLPLSTLPALSNIPTAIAALTSNIASQLEGVLSAKLLAIIVEAEEDASFDPTTFKVTISPMLVGLVRCGKVDTLAGVWRSAVTTAVREGLRQHLPSNDEEEGDTKGPSLSQSLQSLDHAQFLALCKAMYGSMLTRLQRTQEMGEAMSAILAENLEVKALTLLPSSSITGATTQFEPADVLTAACELANTRASKIISVRGEQHAALTLEEFVELFSESWAFVVATETLNKRMIVALRGTLASHARGFLVAYHAKRLTRSAKLVEEETWVQVDAPASTQHAVDLLVEAAVGDPGECFVPPKENGVSVDKASPSKLVSVEGKTFFVVKATAESLTLLSDYLAIVINLELVVTDVISRIIEFLKSFNSRTCQVVLGAGAMRSAGLKNITAKHLALASQSLSVVVALIPYVREFLRRHLSAKQTVMLIEFDKLKRDYQEHQNEIHAKLVAIMADRLAVHCGELREIDWEATPVKEGPHTYALMLVKETATLHKVLSKYLAPPTVEAVMSQVITASVHRLTEEYSRVELKSDAAKTRMLQDVAVVVTRLTPLADGGSNVSSLETLVREKPLPRKPVGAAMRGLLRRNGNLSPTTPAVDIPEDDNDDEGEGLTQEPPEERPLSRTSALAPSPQKSPPGSRTGTPANMSPVRRPSSPSRPVSPTPGSVQSPPAGTPIRSPSPNQAALLSPQPSRSPTKGLLSPERPSSPAKSLLSPAQSSSPPPMSASPERPSSPAQLTSPDLPISPVKSSPLPSPSPSPPPAPVQKDEPQKTREDAKDNAEDNAKRDSKEDPKEEDFKEDSKEDAKEDATEGAEEEPSDAPTPASPEPPSLPPK